MSTRAQTVATIAGQLVAARPNALVITNEGIMGPATDFIEAAVKWADVILRTAERAEQEARA